MLSGKLSKLLGGKSMSLTGATIMLVIGIVMIFFGKARRGEPLAIFQVFIVGQLYLMTAMTLGVFGAAGIIVNWPF
jgi:hypothetical protein